MIRIGLLLNKLCLSNYQNNNKKKKINKHAGCNDNSISERIFVDIGCSLLYTTVKRIQHLWLRHFYFCAKNDFSVLKLAPKGLLFGPNNECRFECNPFIYPCFWILKFFKLMRFGEDLIKFLYFFHFALFVIIVIYELLEY